MNKPLSTEWLPFPHFCDNHINEFKENYKGAKK